jgi:nitrogen fixation NifU-like protein
MSTDAIRDHLESPFHCGVLTTPTICGSSRNPACGDEVTLYLRIIDGAVNEMWHQAKGCLLCKAAASILCERTACMSLQEVAAISEADMLEWIGIPITPGRVQCCTLAVHTLQSILTRAQV